MQDDKIIVIDVNLTRGLVILLVLALLMVTFVGYLAWGQDEAAASGSQIPLAASSGMRQYYLTETFYNGADADDACASGYHMASLWEIMDPSNLKYNSDLGHTESDSGQGPPSNWPGWIRTGSYGSTVDSAGRGNCDVWTSSDSNEYGTFATLPHEWELGQEIHIWHVHASRCGYTYRVWCVED